MKTEEEKNNTIIYKMRIDNTITHKMRIEIPDKEWKFLWNRKLFKGENIKDYIVNLIRKEQQNTKNVKGGK